MVWLPPMSTTKTWRAGLQLDPYVKDGVSADTPAVRMTTRVGVPTRRCVKSVPYTKLVSIVCTLVADVPLYDMDAICAATRVGFARKAEQGFRGLHTSEPNVAIATRISAALMYRPNSATVLLSAAVALAKASAVTALPLSTANTMSAKLGVNP